MKLNDISLGLLLVLAAIAIWLSAQNFSRLPNQAYGSETMPLALSALALGLGVYFVGRSVVAGGRIPWITFADWTRTPGAIGAFAAAIGLVLAYIFLAGRLGFIPVSVGIVLALMLVMKVKWWLAFPSAILATLAIQQAFGRLLLVPLPRSEFLGMFW